MQGKAYGEHRSFTRLTLDGDPAVVTPNDPGDDPGAQTGSTRLGRDRMIGEEAQADRLRHTPTGISHLDGHLLNIAARLTGRQRYQRDRAPGGRLRQGIVHQIVKRVVHLATIELQWRKVVVQFQHDTDPGAISHGAERQDDGTTGLIQIRHLEVRRRELSPDGVGDLLRSRLHLLRRIDRTLQDPVVVVTHGIGGAS